MHRPRTLQRLGWFLAGCGVVLALQSFFVWQHGGDWTLLIRVGAEKPHRAHIEDELGPLVCLDALGHDGQINYLMARDPFGRRGTPALLSEFDNPPYRYRRILYPLLAGGFGLAPPRAALLGLLFWSVFGGGLIAAASAELAARWRLPGVVMILVLLNPGVYLASQVLTADTLAAGLALSGVVFWQRRWPRAAALTLAAAALVRETSLLVSLSLALALLAQRRWRPALLLTMTASLPWLAWSLWVRWAIPGRDGLENLSLPFAGIVRSIPLWWGQGPASVVFGAVGLLLLGAALVITWRTKNRLVFWSCVLWVCLAVVLSQDVWGHPGNALRALTPLWAFVALGYGTPNDCVAL